jgi:hypothetical protein
VFLIRNNELGSLDRRILQTTDGVAIIANALIVSYCLISFFVVRKNLLKKEKWAFWVLTAGIFIIQAASYWSDRQFLNKNFWIVNVSSAILLSGLGLCYLGIFHRERK